MLLNRAGSAVTLSANAPAPADTATGGGTAGGFDGGGPLGGGELGGSRGGGCAGVVDTTSNVTRSAANLRTIAIAMCVCMRRVCWPETDPNTIAVKVEVFYWRILFGAGNLTICIPTLDC